MAVHTCLQAWVDPQLVCTHNEILSSTQVALHLNNVWLWVWLARLKLGNVVFSIECDDDAYECMRVHVRAVD